MSQEQIVYLKSSVFQRVHDEIYCAYELKDLSPRAYFVRSGVRQIVLNKLIEIDQILWADGIALSDLTHHQEAFTRRTKSRLKAREKLGASTGQQLVKELVGSQVEADGD